MPQAGRPVPVSDRSAILECELLVVVQFFQLALDIDRCAEDRCTCAKPTSLPNGGRRRPVIDLNRCAPCELRVEYDQALVTPEAIDEGFG